VPIIAFLSPRRPSHSVGVSRRFLSAVSGAVRSLIAPASLVERPAPVQSAAAAAPEPADLLSTDELPPVEEIEAAAAQYAKAADQARAGDRGKRAAKKVLDRIPAGVYGGWLIKREASNRQTADLDEIRRIFKANGLGELPMKQSTPSLKVERVPAAELVTV
jgi:hypothetical protein